MIDITKDEYWENDYQKEEGNSVLKKFIIKHKIIITLLLILSMLITTNIILLYNFFTILQTM